MRLHGHDANVAALAAAAENGRLHHAWLLGGPQGVGKATFATLAARWLLARAAEPHATGPDLHVAAESRTARLIDGGETTHPDLMRLERLEKPAAKGGAGELARSISVDQVRGLSRLFATTGSFSERRVVVIDAADDLEPSAANALLKSLEEPPQGAVFLLVSHAPARLLPTIRSRCRTLRFAPLGEAAMLAALAQAGVDAAEHAALAAAGEGAPGRAMALAGLDVAALDAALDAMLVRGDAGGAARVALGKALSGKAAAARYALFLQRVPQRIAAHARSLSGEPMAAAIEAWAKARDLAAVAPRLSLDPQTTVLELAGIVAGLAPERRPARA